MQHDGHEWSGGRDGRDSGGWTHGRRTGGDLKSGGDDGRARPMRRWPGVLRAHGDGTASGQDRQSSDGIASPTSSGQDQQSSGQSHVDLGTLTLVDLRRAEYVIQHELRMRGADPATSKTFPKVTGFHREVIIDRKVIAEACARSDACSRWYDTACFLMEALQSSLLQEREAKRREKDRLARKRKRAMEDNHR